MTVIKLGNIIIDEKVIACLSVILACVITFCIHFVKYIRAQKGKDEKQWNEAVSLLWAQIFFGTPIFLLAVAILWGLALGG